MSLTIFDIARRLEQQPEISVLEVLEITSSELVDRFMDKIEDRMDYLEDELGDDDYE